MTHPQRRGLDARFRREPRHITVLIVGRVRDAAGEFACVVSNVSRHGMKARFPRVAAVGERLTVALRGTAERAATVRWSDGVHAGLEFDAPIELASVLATFGEARLPRAPRFACGHPTRFTFGGISRPVALVDVSLGGAKLRAAAIVEPVVGHAGTLMLPILDQPRSGMVRWQGGERVGFQFAYPLALDMLARLLSNPPPEG